MALMEDALAYLQITWQDKTLQRKLEGGIKRGKVLLEEYGGTTLNFDVPGTPQALLFDYYQRDLMRLRNLYGVNGEELEE